MSTLGHNVIGKAMGAHRKSVPQHFKTGRPRRGRVQTIHILDKSFEMAHEFPHSADARVPCAKNKVCHMGWRYLQKKKSITCQQRHVANDSHPIQKHVYFTIREWRTKHLIGKGNTFRVFKRLRVQSFTTTRDG